jgi:hypothetical protein
MKRCKENPAVHCPFPEGKEPCQSCSAPWGLRLSRRKGFVTSIQRYLEASGSWLNDSSWNSFDEVLNLTIDGKKYIATGVNKSDHENFQVLKKNRGRALQYLKNMSPRIIITKVEE